MKRSARGFKVLFRHLPGGAEESYDTPQPVVVQAEIGGTHITNTNQYRRI
jgi:hypothetical protein